GPSWSHAASFSETRSTPASATWPSSRIRTAMCSCFTTATRRPRPEADAHSHPCARAARLARSRLDQERSRDRERLAVTGEDSRSGVPFPAVHLDRPCDHDVLLVRDHGTVDPGSEPCEHSWNQLLVQVGCEVGR